MDKKPLYCITCVHIAERIESKYCRECRDCGYVRRIVQGTHQPHNEANSTPPSTGSSVRLEPTRDKEPSGKIGYKIEVDTTQLDQAITKMERLLELQERLQRGSESNGD